MLYKNKCDISLKAIAFRKINVPNREFSNGVNLIGESISSLKEGKDFKASPFRLPYANNRSDPFSLSLSVYVHRSPDLVSGMVSVVITRTTRTINSTVWTMARPDRSRLQRVLKHSQRSVQIFTKVSVCVCVA